MRDNGPDEHEIEEMQIDRQIEYFDECDNGEHGEDLQSFVKCHHRLPRLGEI
jgi:hypothetical protein